MAFSIPTLQTIIDRVRGDLNSRMGNNNALIPRSLAWVLAHVLAGATWGLYLYQQWIAKQVIPDTAEGEYLERWARIWGLTRTAAVKATGKVEVTGVAGASLSDGAILQRSDAVEYVVVGDWTWTVSGVQNVDVEAVEAGSTANYDCAADAYLELVSPPTGIVAKCPLHSDIDGGLDEESDASLKDRLLARLANPPQGGSKADYVAWAQEALAVVDRVWVIPWTEDPSLDPGQAMIRFTVEEGNGVGGGGVIPTSDQCLTVSNYVDTKKPVTAVVQVGILGESAVSLSLDAHLRTGYTSADAADEIVAELRSLFREKAEVTADGSTLANSYVQEAVARCTSIEYFTITSVRGGGGTDPVTIDPLCYPTCDASNITINLV